MKLRTFQVEAIEELAPGAEWYIGSDKKLVWRDAVAIKPDESVIQAKMAELKAEFTALQYQRDRQYPSIGDQLYMQYHDEIDGTTTWKDAVAKVKADNPKPE